MACVSSHRNSHQQLCRTSQHSARIGRPHAGTRRLCRLAIGEEHPRDEPPWVYCPPPIRPQHLAVGAAGQLSVMFKITRPQIEYRGPQPYENWNYPVPPTLAFAKNHGFFATTDMVVHHVLVESPPKRLHAKYSILTGRSPIDVPFKPIEGGGVFPPFDRPLGARIRPTFVRGFRGGSPRRMRESCLRTARLTGLLSCFPGRRQGVKNFFLLRVIYIASRMAEL